MIIDPAITIGMLASTSALMNSTMWAIAREVILVLSLMASFNAVSIMLRLIHGYVICRRAGV